MIRPNIYYERASNEAAVELRDIQAIMSLRQQIAFAVEITILKFEK